MRFAQRNGETKSATYKSSPRVAADFHNRLQEHLHADALDVSNDVANGLIVGFLRGVQRGEVVHLGVNGNLDVIGAGGLEVEQRAVGVPLTIAPHVMPRGEGGAHDVHGARRDETDKENGQNQLKRRHVGGGVAIRVAGRVGTVLCTGWAALVKDRPEGSAHWKQRAL